MKMVKSLLLGSAAGLVAATAGQAADLPVKAKPVEYVKVCSLYGAGFYYMPGTDLCLKIGGWVRAEAQWGSNGSLTWGDYNANVFQRGTTNLTLRARGYITADAREQTAYGTARGYIAVGLSTNDVGLNTAANQFSANRAFVQFAGFTGGITQSFYDYYSAPAAAYVGAAYIPSSDTGDPGWTVFGYTAQLGNGLSATLALEQRRLTQIVYANAPGLAGTGSIAPGGYPASVNVAGSAITGANSLFPTAGAYGGEQMGDIVANVRLDQAWGGAQVMGALHQVNATYYGTGSSGQSAAPSVLSGANPSNAWGWAVGAGLRLNFPMIGEGDYFQSQFNATEGALRYIFFTPNTNWGANNGSSEAYGVLSDAVYGGCSNGSVSCAATAGGAPTSLQLTSAWGFNASFEHHWSPAWQTSLYGGYDKVTYNSSANDMLCTAANFGGGTGSGAGATAHAGCNNNWSVWGIGSRTQWNVSKTFYMGVDVLYENLSSASTGVGACSGSGTCGTGGYAQGSASMIEPHQSVWSVRFRAHKDFLP